MILKSLSAKAVHGYINLDIRFNETLTFLIGANGCGKSTAIRLIEALMTPSLETLALTSFTSVALAFEYKGEKKINVEKNKDQITIQASWVQGTLFVTNVSSGVEFQNSDDDVVTEYFKKVSIESSAHPVMKAIAELPEPLFLGIDRQNRRQSNFDSTAYLDDSAKTIRRISIGRAIARNDVEDGLREAQLLVREAYRNARRSMDTAQENLRSKVLLSIFEFAVIDNGKISENANYQLDQMESSTTKIARALVDIGLSEREVEHKRSQFMSNISVMFDRLKEANGKAKWAASNEGQIHPFIEFMLNQATLSRLTSIIELVQDFNDRNNRIFGHINRFQEVLNSFFADSRKNFSVDQVGRIVVQKIDKQSSIRLTPRLSQLSSGEKQIILIFAHIFFNRYGSKSKVVVIDEPELSLHARWQESLVDRIKSVSSDTQLIFATHSPDIVNSFDDHCAEIGP